jgi:hypothetical protein
VVGDHPNDSITKPKPVSSEQGREWPAEIAQKRGKHVGGIILQAFLQAARVLVKEVKVCRV